MLPSGTPSLKLRRGIMRFPTSPVTWPSSELNRIGSVERLMVDPEPPVDTQKELLLYVTKTLRRGGYADSIIWIEMSATI